MCRMLKLLKGPLNIARHRDIDIFFVVIPIKNNATVIFLSNQLILCSILNSIYKMVSMGRISVFYPKIVRTKRWFRWECFVERNGRVGV